MSDTETPVPVSNASSNGSVATPAASLEARLAEVRMAERALSAMVDVLQRTTSPEMLQAHQLLLQRLALTGAVLPSRIPPPLNITEVGGYVNLLREISDARLLSQMLASALGVAGSLAGNAPSLGISSVPTIGTMELPNHRPGSAARQAAIPVNVRVRSDFAGALAQALDTIAARGCGLPLLARTRGLPPQGDVPRAPARVDLLAWIGRALLVVPSSALNDPDDDPVALARRFGAAGPSGELRFVTRVLHDVAPAAAEVLAEDWSAVETAPDGSFTETEAERRYFEVEPLLTAAGWYRFGAKRLEDLEASVTPGAGAPATARLDPNVWARLENRTGLVIGNTRFEDELMLLYSPAQIAGSAAAAFAHFVWDGTQFTG